MIAQGLRGFVGFKIVQELGFKIVHEIFRVQKSP
jgi:hypothetical protein